MSDNVGRRELFVTYDRQFFGRGERGNFETYLKRQEDNTALQPLSDIKELQLNSDGLTIENYRFSAAAFSQAAQIIAPGLSKALPDLAGTIPVKTEKTELVDGVGVIEFWNRIIDLRFPLFHNWRIIKNFRRRTIEGFLGTQHKYLENIQLYNYIEETINSFHEVNFRAGVMVGRRMSIWYRTARPIISFTVNGESRSIYAGYYFVNNEIRGTAVRGTQAIFTPWGVCLPRYKKYGFREKHTGKKFEQRLTGHLNALAEKEFEISEITEGIDNLINTSMGYELGWTQEQRNKQKDKIKNSMSLIGAPKNVMNDIINFALTRGQLEEIPIDQTMEINKLYASRTLLDLFVNVVRTARKSSVGIREKLEQAAYTMLVNSIIV